MITKRNPFLDRVGLKMLSPYIQELLEIIPDEGKMLLVDYLAIHHYPRQQLILYWRLKREALHASVQGVFDQRLV